MVHLEKLKEEQREWFIKLNQEAFNYGAMVEFGERDNHFEEDGQIISRDTIERSIDEENSEALVIYLDDKAVGGTVVSHKGTRYDLELLFVDPNEHSHGIGFETWKLIEKRYPDATVWETFTPYFETRNIHFYINKCGFHAVEFYNIKHKEPSHGEGDEGEEYPPNDGFFRFEKVMSKG